MAAVVQPIAFSNMLLGLQEPNVTFCLDISGSMYNKLKYVKEHLVNYLHEQAFLTNLNLNRLFNVIAFSTEIYPWANKMVLWNNATVNKAIEWINDLETKTGTNTLDALTTAYEDINTNTVVLITDDICDQEPHVVLNQVSVLSRGRPCHCIYVANGKTEDKGAIDFLQNLSMSTNGFFKMVNVGRFGIEKIVTISAPRITTSFQFLSSANMIYAPLNLAAPSATTNSLTTTTTTASFAPSQSITSMANESVKSSSQLITSSSAQSACYLVPTQSLIDQVSKVKIDNKFSAGSVQTGHCILINQPVIARVEFDGFFYKGKVLEQVVEDTFTVQFALNGKNEIIQKTPLYDIIHYEDAIRHPIQINDFVLAYADGKRKYGPAVVLSGFEVRGQQMCSYQTSSPLIVQFVDGKTRTLPCFEAIWIPMTLYERIKLEINMPPSARKYLSEKNNSYPGKNLPGYPNTSKAAESKDIAIQNSSSTLAQTAWSSLANSCSSLPPTMLPYPMPTNELLNASQRTSLCSRQIKTNPAIVDAEAVNKNVFGSNLSSEELDKKIKQQIEENIHFLLSEESKKCRSRSRSRESKCCAHEHRERSHSRHEEDHGHEARHHQHRHHEDHEDEKLNPHYQLYKRLCDELYASVDRFGHKLRKSKSAEFSPLGSYRSHCHDHDNEDYEVITSRSRDRSSDSRKSRGSSGHLDRFGNPKVSFGLPDRPGFKAVRSKSATASLNSSFTEASTTQTSTRSSKKMFPSKSEMPYIMNHSLNAKQMKTTGLKKTIPDYPYLRIASKPKPQKKGPPTFHSAFSKPKPLSADEKDAVKVKYLQNQTAKRNLAHTNAVREQAVKEASKLAHNRDVQNKRNQAYHDKLVIEEAMRRASNEQKVLAAKIRAEREAKRERTEKKIVFLKDQLKK